MNIHVINLRFSSLRAAKVRKKINYWMFCALKVTNGGCFCLLLYSLDGNSPKTINTITTMKRLSLIASALAVLGLTACEETTPPHRQSRLEQRERLRPPHVRRRQTLHPATALRHEQREARCRRGRGVGGGGRYIPVKRAFLKFPLSFCSIVGLYEYACCFFDFQDKRNLRFSMADGYRTPPENAAVWPR